MTVYGEMEIVRAAGRSPMSCSITTAATIAHLYRWPRLAEGGSSRAFRVIRLASGLMRTATAASTCSKSRPATSRGPVLGPDRLADPCRQPVDRPGAASSSTRPIRRSARRDHVDRQPPSRGRDRVEELPTRSHQVSDAYRAGLCRNHCKYPHRQGALLSQRRAFAHAHPPRASRRPI